MLDPWFPARLLLVMAQAFRVVKRSGRGGGGGREKRDERRETREEGGVGECVNARIALVRGQVVERSWQGKEGFVSCING